MTHQKIHVVHLIASTGLYGAEKWILALMRAMDNAKVSSTLVNLSDLKNETSAVVAAARERDLDAVDFFTGGTFNPLSIIRFARWLKKHQVDIVHGHGYKADLIGLAAAKLAGSKIMATPHGWSQEADTKLLFYESMDRFFFRFMDYVCPLSEDLLESVKHCTYPDKRALILNGVDIDEVASAPTYDHPSSNTFRVGYVGQLIERKNISTLLNAIKRLHGKVDGVRLIIVGDGPEKEHLQGMTDHLNIQDCVEFFGYRKDALSIMKSFDVFVLPSRLEGIPRCVMEAMGVGVPVVISDIPGNRNLVTHGETGFLFALGDDRGLAEQLNYAMVNRGILTTLQAKAQNKILTKFSNYRMAKEYSEIYSKLS